MNLRKLAYESKKRAKEREEDRDQLARKIEDLSMEVTDQLFTHLWTDLGAEVLSSEEGSLADKARKSRKTSLLGYPMIEVRTPNGFWASLVIAPGLKVAIQVYAAFSAPVREVPHQSTGKDRDAEARIKSCLQEYNTRDSQPVLLGEIWLTKDKLTEDLGQARERALFEHNPDWLDQALEDMDRLGTLEEGKALTYLKRRLLELPAPEVIAEDLWKKLANLIASIYQGPA